MRFPKIFRAYKILGGEQLMRYLLSLSSLPNEIDVFTTHATLTKNKNKK